jgi:hypothetical protein
MHHRLLFRLFHRAHHLWASPTPWAAYSFSAPQAFVQAGIGPLIVFTIPTHPLAFAAIMLWQVAFNVLGHCGHEIYPRWFIRCRAGRVLNSVTHHALHPEHFNAGFGLYFDVWDRLMGTNHPDYQARFHLAARGAGPRGDDGPHGADEISEKEPGQVRKGLDPARDVPKMMQGNPQGNGCKSGKYWKPRDCASGFWGNTCGLFLRFGTVRSEVQIFSPRLLHPAVSR